MNRIAMNSLAFIATCIAVAGPAGAETPQPPHPLGNPGDWAGTEDYPPGPLRREEEGVTGFQVTVQPDGRVATCEITRSSGSDDLDEATCKLITERARFAPATDKRGRKVEAPWSSSIRWKIPKDKPLPQPMELVMSMLVDKDGNVSDCRIERVVGAPAAKLQVGPTTHCIDDSVTGPYVDNNGNPVARRVRVSQKIEVLPESTPLPPNQKP